MWGESPCLSSSHRKIWLWCFSRYSNNSCSTFLKFNQYFASDADYQFVCRSAYDWHYLLSSVIFDMHRTEPGTLSARTNENSLKKQLKGLLLVTMGFPLWSQSKEHQYTGNKFHRLY